MTKLALTLALIFTPAQHHAPRPCATVGACRAELAHARKAVAWQRAARRRLQAHLKAVHRPTIVEAAELAAQALHVDAGEMVSVASCESHLDPYAVNRSSGASGAWQFLRSTWSHTPFARWSPFNPYAQALAVAGIVRVEGWRQWTCRP